MFDCFIIYGFSFEKMAVHFGYGAGVPLWRGTLVGPCGGRLLGQQGRERVRRKEVRARLDMDVRGRFSSLTFSDFPLLSYTYNS